MFSSPTNVRHHNPPLFGAQRPLWHSFLPPIDVGPPPNPPPFGALAHRLVSTPLRGTTRRLAHRSVSGSDNICNDPDPPLVDIVLFGLSLSNFPSRLWNASTRGRFPHSYKWWFVLPNLGHHRLGWIDWTFIVIRFFKYLRSSMKILNK